MIVAGIDVGGKNVHAVIASNGDILAKVEGPSGIKKAEAAEQLYEEALKQAGVKRGDVERVVATGSSGQRVTFADGVIPDAAADARGVIQFIPSARTIIDVGAEEGRAIKISPEGKVLDFAINERCAAGTGTFVDTMARALEIPLDEMAKLSMQSTRSIPMNAQCAVFGESEVVSLIHQKTPKHDIARAVHDAIAGRIGSVARIVGLEDDVVMVGGVAKNVGFVESLKRALGTEVKVPDTPDFIGALGAAAAAVAGVLEEKVEAKVVEKETIEEGKS
ncbi:MAG: acyl-CoA dehydratase activase [Dehalococcoidia bacterium]|nr:acyl-CoA dehydratase activase [Dehalococcoidia bacterium]